MAASRFFLSILLTIFLGIFTNQVFCDITQNFVTISNDQVSELLIKSAVNSLNDSTKNYKNARLVSAQKLDQPPYTINRLTLNLEPLCQSDNCLNVACILDVRQHDRGVIDILQHSVQCAELQPGWTVDDLQKKLQSNQQEGIAKSLETQIGAEQNVRLEEPEIQTPDDRNYVAVKPSSKYCAGCPYELNPSLPGLSSFGEQALQSMDDSGLSDFKHKLVGIIRVTRAVPPGGNVIEYQLLMEIGESNCLTSSLIERSQCTLQSNLPIKLCLVKFSKKYSYETNLYSKKITSNNCTDFSNDSEVHAASVAANSHLAEEQENHKTEFYDQIAQEAQEVYRLPSSDEPMVDNGPIADDHRYSGIPVIEELIEPKQVEERLSIYPIVESIRVRRSIKEEKGKTFVQKLAAKIVDILDAQDDDKTRLRVVEVLESSEERRDHGIGYHMTIEIAPTDCSENDKLATECLDEIPGPSRICKFNILTSEKKPLEKPKILHYSCKTNQKSIYGRFKRSTLLGAPSSIDVEDPEVKEIINHGLRTFSASYAGPHEPFVTVTSVTRQVVSGSLYRIKVDAGASTCQKGKKDNCQLRSGEELKKCTIEAWSQPWLDKGVPQIKILCNDKREKRSLRGVNYSQKMLAQMQLSKEERLFNEFLDKYGKKYESKERNMRYKIFKQNLDVIEELQRNEQGTARYGVTQFADLTKEEFKQRHLGLKPRVESENHIPLPEAKIPDIQLPEEFDWRHYNAVTPVKNQGSCGSCWAFSVTGNIEGQYAIKHNTLYSFSEQELLDCDTMDSACNGGLPDTAYRALETIGGLELEQDYPYDADKETCHFDHSKAKVTVRSGLNITTNETQIAQWLVKNGPVSIGINANAMQFYYGGVSHPFKFLCNPKDLDHGVLIVGFGIKNYPIFKKRMPYWIVKNSWGPTWGEQGYYRVYRGDGTCGVNQMVTSAIID